MKVLELFAGTGSIGNAFRARGHEVFAVDWDEAHDGMAFYADIEFLTAEDILLRFGRPDVIWTSPDCTTYSVAGIRYHRVRNLRTQECDPVSEYAKKCDRLNQNLQNLISELDPKLWFIENPVDALRKMRFMRKLPRYTITYCQYGFPYQKPTDIWTNHASPQFKPPCKRGDTCHISAGRGDNKFSSGIRNKHKCSVIRAQLCEHIVNISESYMEE